MQGGRVRGIRRRQLLLLSIVILDRHARSDPADWNRAIDEMVPDLLGSRPTNKRRHLVLSISPSCGRLSRNATGGAWLRGRVIACDLATSSFPFINSAQKQEPCGVARPALSERSPVFTGNLQLTCSPRLRLIRKRRMCQMDRSKSTLSRPNCRAQLYICIMHKDPVREFGTGAGPSDYGLFVDKPFCGVIDARPPGPRRGHEGGHHCGHEGGHHLSVWVTRTDSTRAWTHKRAAKGGSRQA
jgi:hypothetical protein